MARPDNPLPNTITHTSSTQHRRIPHCIPKRKNLNGSTSSADSPPVSPTALTSGDWPAMGPSTSHHKVYQYPDQSASRTLNFQQPEGHSLGSFSGSSFPSFPSDIPPSSRAYLAAKSSKSANMSSSGKEEVSVTGGSYKRKRNVEDDIQLVPALDCKETTTIDSSAFTEGNKFRSFEAFESLFNDWHKKIYPNQRLWTRKLGPYSEKPGKVCNNEGCNAEGEKVCKFRIKLEQKNNSSRFFVIEVGFYTLHCKLRKYLLTYARSFLPTVSSAAL